MICIRIVRDERKNRSANTKEHTQRETKKLKNDHAKKRIPLLLTASKFASRNTLSNFASIFLQHSRIPTFLSSTAPSSSHEPIFRKLFVAGTPLDAFSLVILLLAFRKVKHEAFKESAVVDGSRRCVVVISPGGGKAPAFLFTIITPASEEGAWSSIFFLLFEERREEDMSLYAGLSYLFSRSSFFASARRE
jgi:hypothetical protein